MRLEEEIKYKKANQRFNLYIIFFIFMMGLALGVSVKLLWEKAR